jgi:type II secretory pathway component PulJ
VAPRVSGGFTLPEIMVIIPASALIAGALFAVVVFSARNFAVLVNQVDLTDNNRLTWDQLTRDTREATNVVNTTSNSLTFLDPGGIAILYDYDANEQTLTRVRLSETNILLKGCSWFNVSLGQRNVRPDTFESYPATQPGTRRVITVAWACARDVPLATATNTEMVKLCFALRKQD